MASQSPVLESWARAGYLVRGLVYLIIGALALLSALGRGGSTTDSKGAMHTILSQPFGEVLLALTTAGLLGYASWKFAQAVLDADHRGHDLKAVLIRAGNGFGMLAYLFLAVYAAGLVLGWGISSTGKQALTAQLMALPLGRWLVGLVAAGILTAGCGQIIAGVRGSFRQWLRRDEAWITALSRAGLISRGLVFVLIAGLFGWSAYTFDPGQAGGVAEALATLRQQPHGRLLLGLTGVGLMTFAGFSCIQAAYRRIDWD